MRSASGEDERARVKVRSELEIGRRLAFVLELIACGEVKAKMPGSVAVTASIEGGAGDPSSQDCLSAITGKGVRDQIPDQRHRLGSSLLALGLIVSDAGRECGTSASRHT